MPSVVINAQRPGLPARTEQVSFAGLPQGVLAQAFSLMGHAFYLAERFQMPLVVLSDRHLADSFITIGSAELSQIEIERAKVAAGKEGGPDYRRYKFTEMEYPPPVPRFWRGRCSQCRRRPPERGCQDKKKWWKSGWLNKSR